jgi:catechol 2,3-dioxygenase-like lactoylglutathione lyase family enzyme
VLLVAALLPAPSRAQSGAPAPKPRLHHVGLNSVDPERAIAWYLALWPAATRTTIDGKPAVQADMMLVFEKVTAPPSGAWRHDLHRSEPQSAFWHIGVFTNTTPTAERLATIGVRHLPLFTSPTDTVGVWRSGLAPYAGTVTRATLGSTAPAAPREGGFSYVVAPDGVLFELTGGPGTRDSFSHVHFFSEEPQCTANWYVQHLGLELPPVRDAAGVETPRRPYDPCPAPPGEAGWPSLEKIGTIRQPNAAARFDNGTMSWYPRQCVGARCGRAQPLVPSRGQALDHLAFVVTDFDALFARLEAAGVRILERPHRFGDTRAFMIQDIDGLAVELVERKGPE